MLADQKPPEPPERRRLRLLPLLEAAPDASLEASRGGTVRASEGIAFSSLLAAAVAPALCAAAAFALGTVPDPRMLALAFGGTLAVYNVDRLRDLERDRLTAPRRSAFVARHRSGLVALALGGAALAVACAWQLGPPVWGVCGVVLALGLLHRRLKHDAVTKAAYVTLAWLAITVGLPALASDATLAQVGWLAAVFTPAVAANLVASNAGPLAAAGRDWTVGRALRWAAGLAMAGVAAALLAPSAQVALAWVPLLQLGSLLSFRRGEHYRLLALDGSLGLGALVAVFFLI